MSRSVLLLSLACLLALAHGKAANDKTCSTGIEEENPDESLDGAHNARLGFQFMQEARKNPELMQDVMKDMQDPETMAEVQKMMQDPAFQAEVARYKDMMMKDPQVRAQLEALKNNPEALAQMGEQMMRNMGAGAGAGAAGGKRGFA